MQGQQKTFTLENFEGPIDLLLYLVQKHEIDVHGVAMRELMHQYLSAMEELVDKPMDQGAEFVGHAASLMLLKSRMLLNKGLDDEQSEDEALQFEVLQHLVEYRRFKELASGLLHKKESKERYFPRMGAQSDAGVDRIKGTGLSSLRVDDLAWMLQEAFERAAAKVGEAPEDEEWRVADKIVALRGSIGESPLSVETIFAAGKHREELVVIFLALLELLKQGEVMVTKDAAQGVACCKVRKEDGTRD